MTGTIAENYGECYFWKLHDRTQWSLPARERSDRDDVPMGTKVEIEITAHGAYFTYTGRPQIQFTPEGGFFYRESDL